MSTNGANKSKEEVDRATVADLNFQDRLEGHSKRALILLVDQLTSVNRNRRGWVLKYLHGVERLFSPAKAEHLQDSVFEAIKNERLARDVRMGPVAMRPRTLDDWSYSLVGQARKAYRKATYGQRLEAMKALLQLAAEAIEALEDRIDAEAEAGKDLLAEAIKVVTGNPGKSSLVRDDFKTKKKADAATTAPAGKSESLNNQ